MLAEFIHSTVRDAYSKIDGRCAVNFTPVLGQFKCLSQLVAGAKCVLRWPPCGRSRSGGFDQRAASFVFNPGRFHYWLAPVTEPAGRQHAAPSEGNHHIRTDIEEKSLAACRPVIRRYALPAPHWGQGVVANPGRERRGALAALLVRRSSLCVACAWLVRASRAPVPTHGRRGPSGRGRSCAPSRGALPNSAPTP